MSLVLTKRDVKVPSVALIILNRPDQMNAYNIDLHNALMNAIQTANQDPSVRVIVVTGAGRAFCAGADISRGFNANGLSPDTGGILNLAIFECDTPIIAAINGAAVGIGSTMTLPMDLRIASTKTKFAFPFARIGIAFDGVASWFLPQLVGFSKANEWVLKGNILSADELYRAGLISELCEPEDVLPRALEVARDIAENCSPTSVSNNKRLLRASMLAHGVLKNVPYDMNDMETTILEKAFASDDAVEGALAFVEKRTPKFVDRTD